MIKSILFIILLLNTACGYYFPVYPGETNSCSFRTDRGFVVKWKELPIPVYIHSDVSDQSHKNFIYVMDMWNESWNYHSGQGRLFEFIGETEVDYILSKDAKGDGINIVFMDSVNHFLTSDKQGTTHILNTFGGSIFEGDIVVNNIHYRYYYENNDFEYSDYTNVPKLSTSRTLASHLPKTFLEQFIYVFKSVFNFLNIWKVDNNRAPTAATKKINPNQVDFISLVLHEFGHLSGLQHIDYQKSIMNSRLKKGELRRKIGELELSQLSCGYKDSH